jgi:hypothetical protein
MSKKTQEPANAVSVKIVDAQTSAKATAGKVSELVKANVQVAVASGKALAGGLKAIGTGYAADSRKAVAVLRDDMKAISKVKSAPAFVRLQGEQTARNIEAVTAVASKNFGALRTLVAGEVAPMVKDRFKANLALFRKAA